MLRFKGNTITGFVDTKQVIEVSDSTFTEGMAGLVSGSSDKTTNKALFDNLMIKPCEGATPPPTVFDRKIYPIYKSASK
jgi:galactosylceramidase